MNFSVNAHTRRGVARRRNEDACGISSQLLFGEDRSEAKLSFSASDLPLLITLADGVGGHEDGDKASRIAVKTLSEVFSSENKTFDIPSAIENTDRTLKEAAINTRASSAMASTIVGAVITTSNSIIFNVGDSPAYLIRDEKIRQLSTDDVLPGSKSGAITQCLGGGSHGSPRPHVVEETFRHGDFLLLCSDGVTDFVTDDCILETVLTGKDDVAHDLCQEAVRYGGGDDASAIFIVFSTV